METILKRPSTALLQGYLCMALVQRDRLLSRFLEYVRIDTTADDTAEQYPSSAGQWELGKLLCRQLEEMGAEGVYQDEHALVWARLPANVDSAPAIAFNSHLDTSPETTGANVRPQVIDEYRGGDIILPGDSTQIIRLVDNPELDTMIGRTLITTDGTTLLGADDKAGLAIIMEGLATLIEHHELPRPTVRVVFTCDEEIGRGIQHLDVGKLEAVAAYTFDGPGADQIDVETFSADLATVTFRGVNIHPSIAKDRMVNAVRGAGMFVAALPRTKWAPESTEGRQGFLHPYKIEGGVGECTLSVLLRDFDTPKLEEYAEFLRETASQIERTLPGIAVSVDVRPQYRNLAEGLRREPRAVDYAVAAHRRLGRQPTLSIIRGGTDGSMMTERGLPTPNLSSGQHNPHSKLEWACLDEMVAATELMIELAAVWATGNT